MADAIPAADQQKHVSHESGQTLMAHGPHVLYEHVSTKLEAALGRALPQMEVRFSNLSLSADIVVIEDDASKSSQVPTLLTTVKKMFVSAKKHKARKEILKNVSGCFKSGTITLLLGQPSSGKSSLMKLLSGRFPLNKNITLEGEITYNGVAREEIAKIVPQFAAYASQRDQHHPVLTVKETLEVAHAFTGSELSRRGEELLSKGTPEENAVALDAVRALSTHYPDVVLQQLGLQNCQDTVVGDAMLRGVSGGERKRVTTGEMEFGMKYLTLMDEISTGLDSAATFDIVNTQRSIAKKLRKTVVIALLQPSPEVFSLFDDVMIMNEGEVMYHGPREQVVEYFASLGFVCPPERDIADFLLDLGTKQQSMYEVDTPSRSVHPRFANQFAEVFRKSVLHDETLRALTAPHEPELLANVRDHMDHLPEFHQSFWESTATLFHRQILVQFRNTPFVASRLAMIVIMGLLNASTFYQFDPKQIQVVMGILFSAVLFLSTGQFPQLPTFFAARDIFYKQRRANFFRTSAYVLANAVAQLPMAITETVLFGTLVYWMCGFASSATEFIVFEVIMLLVTLTFSMFFFFLSAICPDNNVATPVSMTSINAAVVFSGFIILKSKMPDYFIWIYWINPVSWSVRGLAVNQYRSAAFDVCVSDGVNYCAENNGRNMGEYYLSLFDVATEKYWIYYAMVVMAGYYALFMTMAYVALEYKRYEAPESVIISSTKDEVHEDGYVLAGTPKHSQPSLGPENSPSGTEVVLEVKPTHISNFIPVTLAFKDLWYTVPLPSNPSDTIDLLKGITGYALPGTITALMGSSGAGKTTLMDVIAGRKTGGQIRGQILLNGHEATDLSIRRSTGYCEQMDIHSNASTIREALVFSAFLRQDSSVPVSKKYDSVNECLDLLDLRSIADQMVRGRSVEQMKRLTIGVELAAQPSVLFLDEPTSGLDARSAKLIMDGVRKVADTGRTVVCTIHQPSSEVFFLFDSLLLLKRGGETVFFGDLGENCRNLVDYFERIPGVAPLPTGYNPATWMLECIGAGVGGPKSASGAADGDDKDTDFVHVFDTSAQKMALQDAMMRPGVATPSDSASQSSELVFSQKRAASSATQAKFVIGRYIDLYWRSPSYNMTRYVMMLFLSLLFGLIFTGADYASYQGVNSGVGMLYIVTAFSGFVAFTSVIPIASQERPSFYRERASQTYNAFWYFVGSTIAEIPYVFSSSLLFTLIFYPLVGFTGKFATAVLFWLNFSLMVLMQTYVGQLLAFALPSEEVAAIVSILLNNILLLFMGFSPPADQIPTGYQWLHTITPQRFPLSIAAALIFADCSTTPAYDSSTDTWSEIGPELGCQPLANSPVTLSRMTVKEFTENVFGMAHDDILVNFLVVLAYIVGFRILGALALRFVNHQKRGDQAMLAMIVTGGRRCVLLRQWANRAISNRRQLLQKRHLRSWSPSRDDAAFQFKCTQCGKCCTGKGGRVRVNEREIEEIASALGAASTAEIKTTHLRRSVEAGNEQPREQQWWFLKQTPDDSQCVFLDGTKCSIYKARPTQCRTFPWWPQHLISDYDWQLTARDCEGITLPSTPSSDSPAASPPIATPMSKHTDTYTFDDILPEVILHDIHRSGENFTYDELSEMLADLQEVDEDFVREYKSELFANYSRKIVFRDADVTVLDTFLRGETPTRCFFFNDRIHLVQSEVALQSDDLNAIDRSHLVLDVHRAMCIALALLESSGDAQQHPDKEEKLRVAVLGSGAASLPLFLLEHVDQIGHLDAVEPSAAVNRVAREFFGLGDAERNDTRVELHEQMGEAFVAEQLSRGMRYDLIALDVESGDWGQFGVKAPPASMLTTEFLGSLKELLVASSGVLVVNVIAETTAALERTERAFASVFSSRRAMVVQLPKNSVFYLFADDVDSNTEEAAMDDKDDGTKAQVVALLSRDAFQSAQVQSPALLLKSASAVRRLRAR